MARNNIPDDAIDLFFRAWPARTRQDCDAAAAAIAAADAAVSVPVAAAEVPPAVTPLPIQGTSSYSVVAGPNQDKIVQFRTKRLPLKMLELAHSIFGSFVPKTTYHGDLYHGVNAGDPQLTVYVHERIKGATYAEAGKSSPPRDAIIMSPDIITWRSNAVADFAR